MRYCYCGESEGEHDAGGACLYCECERFSEDVDAEYERAAQDGDDWPDPFPPLDEDDL